MFDQQASHDLAPIQELCSICSYQQSTESGTSAPLAASGRTVGSPASESWLPAPSPSLEPMCGSGMVHPLLPPPLSTWLLQGPFEPHKIFPLPRCPRQPAACWRPELAPPVTGQPVPRLARCPQPCLLAGSPLPLG